MKGIDKKSIVIRYRKKLGNRIGFLERGLRAQNKGDYSEAFAQYEKCLPEGSSINDLISNMSYIAVADRSNTGELLARLVKAIKGTNDSMVFVVLLDGIAVLYSQGKFDAAAESLKALGNYTVQKAVADKYSARIAYYGYLTSLIRLYQSNRNFFGVDGEPVYLIGDSHCLSPAFIKIEALNRSAYFKPYLVLGLKFFHIASLNAFYVKQLQAFFKTVPQHSAVLISCGEIDLRESGGYLSAYDSFENAGEAIQTDLIKFKQSLMVWEEKYRISIYPVFVPMFCRAQNIRKVTMIRNFFNNELMKNFYERYVDPYGDLGQSSFLDGFHVRGDVMALNIGRKLRELGVL